MYLYYGIHINQDLLAEVNNTNTFTRQLIRIVLASFPA
jgi:hypothetical protein